jgi:hypothetical protein
VKRGRGRLLANVYLHYVFDLWAERWRRHEATGDMILVRYADDIVVGFEHETDARRCSFDALALTLFTQLQLYAMHRARGGDGRATSDASRLRF